MRMSCLLGPQDGARISTYFVINPPTANDVSWPPPALLDDEDLDRFAHPLQPVTGD